MNQPYDPRHQGDAGDQQQGGYQAGPGGQYGQGGYGQGQPGGQYGGQYGEGQQYGGQYGEGQQYGGQYGEGQQYGQGGYGQGQSGDQYGQGGYGQGQYGQGAYGQGEYGQGEYGQGGYGQGGYGQGEYGQGGYGQGQYGGGYVPPSGSGSKRPPAWIWAVVAVVVLAAAGVGAYFVFKGDNSKPSASSSSSAPGTSGPSASSSGGGSSSSSAPGGDTSGRSITLPSSFDSYQQIKSFDTSSLKTQLGAELAQFGTSSTSVVQHAQIGVYSKGSAATPSVVFIALALDDVPKLKDMVNAQGVESAVNEFVSGANGKLSGGGSPVIVSPGSLGGSMQCSVGNTSGQNIGFCGWGDKSIFAITIVTDAADPQAAAGVTRDLREAAEH